MLSAAGAIASDHLEQSQAPTKTDPLAALKENLNLLRVDPENIQIRSQIFTELFKAEVSGELKSRAKKYLEEFQFQPILEQNATGTKFAEPIKFSVNSETLDRVYELIFFEAGAHKNQIKTLDAIIKPEVIAKLAVVYEHGFMIGVKSEKDKDDAVRKVLRQLVEEDASLRFTRTLADQDIKAAEVYKSMQSDPKSFALGTIAHYWACRNLSIDPFDTLAQIKSVNGSNPILSTISEALNQESSERAVNKLLSNIRREAPIPADGNTTIGESLFFQPLQDKDTFALSQFLLNAFERGICNVEISADMLPFDPSKRLAAEFSNEEIARVRELSKLLNLHLTVHSPIVGPLHQKTKFTAVLEDAADNPQIMKKTIDLAEALGAKTVVMHLSDRLNPEAIKSYAEIVEHALDKKAADGTPLVIACENYMSKKRADGSKPFPTITEHFEAFEKVVFELLSNLQAKGKDPTQALKHIGILLDSAHLNLVNDFDEDPIKAVFDLAKLVPAFTQRLTSDPRYSEALAKTGFDSNLFYNEIVAQLHLNQNIGPITFTTPGQDFNADIHNPVESIGSIDNIAFVSLIHDFGFGSTPPEYGPQRSSNLIILAEQKKLLSPGGLQILFDAARDSPYSDHPPGAARVAEIVKTGNLTIEKWERTKPEEFIKFKNLLCGEEGPKEFYSYLAGRFGLQRLIDHLKNRAYHHLFSAQIDPDYIESASRKGLPLPFNDVILTQLEPGSIIIKKGTTLKEAKDARTNKFYMLVAGSVIVIPDENKKFELLPGTPFGEAMFISGVPRNATVIAGMQGAKVIEISEKDFWSAYSRLTPFQTRVDAWARKSS